MDRIKQELAGYMLPNYVEEILTKNYCPGFVRMSMIKEQGRYSFSYKPGIYKKMNQTEMSLYEKMILIKSLVTVIEKNKEHLIWPETYLIEPELIYLKDNKVSSEDVRIMYYPDLKSLNYRYKLMLFADRILDKKNKDEREAADQLRQSSESGDINRIKLMLDKQIMRLENRMAEGRSM